jgi:hypothetical protein
MTEYGISVEDHVFVALTRVLGEISLTSKWYTDHFRMILSKLKIPWNEEHHVIIATTALRYDQQQIHPALLKYVDKPECSSEDRQAIKEHWMRDSRDTKYLESRRKSFQHLLDYEVVHKYLYAEDDDKQRIMMLWDVLVWEIALLDEMLA